jgi:HAMP domain-containing protein
MAQVTRQIVLGKEASFRTAIQQILVNTSELKAGFSAKDIAHASWMGTPATIAAFTELFSIVPSADRKAMLQNSPQPVSREIVMDNKAGYIVSWASLPVMNQDLQLTFITFVDRDSLLKSFRSFVVKQTFFAFLILGAGFIFALIASRRLSKPVEQIANAAKILETGDFKVRVKIDRSDEIGDLAGAFKLGLGAEGTVDHRFAHIDQLAANPAIMDQTAIFAGIDDAHRRADQLH